MDKTDIIKMISANAHAKRYKAGDFIVKEGSPANEGLCFVLTGTVRIVQYHGERMVPLGLIQTGQFFGETAMLLNRNRSATAIADSAEVIIMFLNRERFLAEARTNYGLIRVLVSEAVERIEHVIQTLVRMKRTIHIQIDPTLKPIIRENRVSNLQIPQLLNHTRHIFIGHDKSVYTQGQRNDGLIYLVTQGVVGAIRTFDGTPTELYQFEAGDFFGYSRPDSATFREFSAIALNDTARVISFDEELLFRLMRLNINLFYGLFRTLISHLVILDDTLRLAAAQVHRPLASSDTQELIATALSEGVIEEAMP